MSPTPHSFPSSCVFVCVLTNHQSWTTDRAAKIRSIRSPTVPLVSKNHTAIRAGVGTQISVESPVKNVGITNLYGNGGTIPLGGGSDPEDVKQTDSPTAADGSPVSKSVSFLSHFCVHFVVL